MKMVMIPAKEYHAMQRAVRDLREFGWPNGQWRGEVHMKGCIQPISEVIRTAAACDAQTFAKLENVNQ